MLTKHWKKSTRSGSGGNCVEAKADDGVRVRDSKDKNGGQLGFTPADWTAFLDRVKHGAFDL